MDSAAQALSAWSQSAGLPGLAAQGIGPEARAAAALAAATSSSMKANPAPLSAADLVAVQDAAA
jgi:hypothetical protein